MLHATGGDAHWFQAVPHPYFLPPGPGDGPGPGGDGNGDGDGDGDGGAGAGVGRAEHVV